MKTLPADVAVYKRTPTFTDATVPPGLTRNHTTRADTWGRIVVLSGRLRYRIAGPPAEDITLEPGSPGIIEPAASHAVEALGAVEFYVEFLRATAP